MATPPRAQNSAFYEFSLAVLAIVSVTIGIYDYMVPREHAGFTWLDYLDLSIVAVFIIDFAVSAKRRGSLVEYSKENWWEIPTLVPITGAMLLQLQGFSMIRALRLIRIVRFLRVVRVAGVAFRLRDSTRYMVRVAQRAQLVKLAGVGLVVIFIGSLAGHLAERHVDSPLAVYGDALWWALNMFTNVAYVDFQPATLLGRIIAAILEFLGIAFVGIFAGSIANALLREPDEEAPPAAGAARKADDAQDSAGATR